MQTQKRNLPDAESIVSHLVNWGEPEMIRKDLRELMDCYFLNERNVTEEELHAVYFSFKLIDETLVKIERLAKVEDHKAVVDMLMMDEEE